MTWIIEFFIYLHSLLQKVPISWFCEPIWYISDVNIVEFGGITFVIQFQIIQLGLEGNLEYKRTELIRFEKKLILDRKISC